MTAALLSIAIRPALAGLTEHFGAAGSIAGGAMGAMAGETLSKLLTEHGRKAGAEAGDAAGQEFQGHFKAGFEGGKVLREVAAESGDAFRGLGGKLAATVMDDFNKAVAGGKFDLADLVKPFELLEDAVTGPVMATVGKIPLIGGALRDLKGDFDTITASATDFMQVVVETGDTYIEAMRKMAGATTDMHQLEGLTADLREVAASGAIVHFEDIANNIGRLNTNIANLNSTQLKELVTTFAEAEELVGKFDSTKFAGVINAWGVDADHATEMLTNLVNISRQTGLGMDQMQQEMIQVGPAMRAFGYDAGQVGQFFAEMTKAGEPAQRAVFMWTKAFASATKSGEDPKTWLANQLTGIKQLLERGDTEAAAHLFEKAFGQRAAPMMLEDIKKGLLDIPELMKPMEGIDAPIHNAVEETKSLGDAFEVVGRQMTAALEPLGIHLAHGLVEAGTKVSEWLEENQDKIVHWSTTIAVWIERGAQDILQMVADGLGFVSGMLNPIKEMVTGFIEYFMSQIHLAVTALSHLPIIGHWFTGAKQALDDLAGAMQKIDDIDFSHGAEEMSHRLHDLATHGMGGLIDKTRELGESFEANSKITEAFEEHVGGKIQAAVQQMHDAQGKLVEGTPEAPFNLQLMGNPEQNQDIINKLHQQGIDIQANTAGVITAITFANQKAHDEWVKWYEELEKKPVDVKMNPQDKDGHDAKTSGDLLPPGSVDVQVVPKGVTMVGGMPTPSYMVPGQGGQVPMAPMAPGTGGQVPSAPLAPGVGGAAPSGLTGTNQQAIANYIVAKAMSLGYSREQANQFVVQAVGESSLSPTASNPSGWEGIFQFDQPTWASAGGGDVHNAQQNIDNYFRLAQQRGLTPSSFTDPHQLGTQVSIGGPLNPRNVGAEERARAAAAPYIAAAPTGTQGNPVYVAPAPQAAPTPGGAAQWPTYIPPGGPLPTAPTTPLAPAPVSPREPRGDTNPDQVGPGPGPGGQWKKNEDNSYTAYDAKGNATGGYIHPPAPSVPSTPSPQAPTSPGDTTSSHFPVPGQYDPRTHKPSYWWTGKDAPKPSAPGVTPYNQSFYKDWYGNLPAATDFDALPPEVREFARTHGMLDENGQLKPGITLPDPYGGVPRSVKPPVHMQPDPNRLPGAPEGKQTPIQPSGPPSWFDRSGGPSTRTNEPWWTGGGTGHLNLPKLGDWFMHHWHFQRGGSPESNVQPGDTDNWDMIGGGHDYPPEWYPWAPPGWHFDKPIPPFPMPPLPPSQWHKAHALGFDNGGDVPWLPGTRWGVDGVYGVVAPGEHIWTEPEVAAAGGHGEVARIRALALSGKLRGFQGGGGADVAAAGSISGTPYSQGSRTDCSGMVARVVDSAVGIQATGGDLMSTKNAEQWLAARGFVPGVGGPGEMTVYWYDHGPNPDDGHMVMVLSNGQIFESGGSSGVATVGAHPNMSQFDRSMHRAPGIYGEGPAGGVGLTGLTGGAGGGMPSPFGAGGGGGGGGGGGAIGPGGMIAPGYYNPWTAMPVGGSEREQQEYRTRYEEWQQGQISAQQGVTTSAADLAKAQSTLATKYNEFTQKQSAYEALQAKANTPQLQADYAEELKKLAGEAESAHQAWVDASNGVTSAQNRNQDAINRETIERDKPPPKPSFGRGGRGEFEPISEQFGKGFLKGVFQELGLGDVFGALGDTKTKPFTEWGIWKLFTGGLGYGMGLMQNMGSAATGMFGAGGPLAGQAGEYSPAASQVAGGFLGGLIPSIAPMARQMNQQQPAGAPGMPPWLGGNVPANEQKPNWLSSILGMPGPPSATVGPAAMTSQTPANAPTAAATTYSPSLQVTVNNNPFVPTPAVNQHIQDVAGSTSATALVAPPGPGQPSQ